MSGEFGPEAMFGGNHGRTPEHAPVAHGPDEYTDEDLDKIVQRAVDGEDLSDGDIELLQICRPELFSSGDDEMSRAMDRRLAELAVHDEIKSGVTQGVNNA